MLACAPETPIVIAKQRAILCSDVILSEAKNPGPESLLSGMQLVASLLNSTVSSNVQLSSRQSVRDT
jgi:hypothetical protein